MKFIMKSKMIHILGGGPAGLIAAYFAHKNNIPFKVYEAGGTWGGNCRTLTRNKFRFDAGAHRFHDKDPAVTELVNELLGDDLLEVNSPSQIYYDNRFIDFPLRAHNIIKKLPFKVISKVVAENLAKGREASNGYSNFKDFADAKYGSCIIILKSSWDSRRLISILQLPGTD